MRELKNKEIIAGLILLIVLSITAMILIVKQEVKKNEKKTENVIVSSETGKSAEPQEQIQAEKKEAAELTAADTAVNTQKKASTAVKVQTGFYTKTTMKENRAEDSQMEELFYYWDAYKLDAVDDLIRLPRVRTLTDELEGTGQYYYYGDTNKNGEPSGKGLAIYEDNAYYCGEWKNGVRSGEGMWLKIYPDGAVTLDGVSGITAHSYNGTFSNDYPNGKGQEHFDYDFNKLSEESIANVIGKFVDGYYDGELYIMTVSSETNSTDWSAEAQKGVFQPLENKKSSQGKDPVWKEMTDQEEDVYNWMYQEENRGFGVYDLKK